MSKKVDTKNRQYEFLQKYLNSSRKDTKPTAEESPKKSKKSAKKDETDDDWLTKKAIELLQKECAINKVKRKAFGSVTKPKANPNRRFLESTLRATLSHNQREIQRNQKNSIDKYKELERSRKRKKREEERERKPEKRRRSRFRSSPSRSRSRRRGSSTSSDD